MADKVLSIKVKGILNSDTLEVVEINKDSIVTVNLLKELRELNGEEVSISISKKTPIGDSDSEEEL